LDILFSSGEPIICMAKKLIIGYPLWFLSTFPSLAGLNHLLDAEGNEVAQQDT
jgi:hypothetical protein